MLLYTVAAAGGLSRQALPDLPGTCIYLAYLLSRIIPDDLVVCLTPSRSGAASAGQHSQTLELLLAEFVSEGGRKVPQKQLQRFLLAPAQLEHVRQLLMAVPSSRAQASVRFRYIEVRGKREARWGGICCCCCCCRRSVDCACCTWLHMAV
jgi:hypothetical protein